MFPNIFPSELFSALNISWWDLISYLVHLLRWFVKAADTVNSRAMGAYVQAVLDEYIGLFNLYSAA